MHTHTNTHKHTHNYVYCMALTGGTEGGHTMESVEYLRSTTKAYAPLFKIGELEAHTLHNYYAPIWLLETDEIMHPAQLLCTCMATGN